MTFGTEAKATVLSFDMHWLTVFWRHMGVSEIGGTLMGVLILRESYYLESILGVLYFRKAPYCCY